METETHRALVNSGSVIIINTRRDEGMRIKASTRGEVESVSQSVSGGVNGKWGSERVKWESFRFRWHSRSEPESH